MGQRTSATAAGRARTKILVVLLAMYGCYVANAQPCDDMVSRVTESGTSAGRAQLAQGIALYESKNLLMAERALQSALFTGLSDRSEQAAAHKYLAYIYCSRQEMSRCETSFEAAFVARPSFALQPFELQGTPWREAYLRAQQRAPTRCLPSPAGQVAGQQNIGLPHLFALHSTVIASATPLTPTAVSSSTLIPQAPAGGKAVLPLGHNTRIQAKPWAQVFVNGRQVGVSPPLVSLKLDAGRHSIELRNPGFEAYRQTIQITEGSVVTISHDFENQ